MAKKRKVKRQTEESESGEETKKQTQRIFGAIAIICGLVLSGLVFWYFYDRKIVRRFDTDTLPYCTPEQVYKATLPQNKRREMLVLLQIVHRVFGQLKITYWLSCGSLLGCVRDGEIIPSDDDLDIAVLKNEYLDWNRIEAELQRNGLRIIRLKEGYSMPKIVFQKDWPQQDNTLWTSEFMRANKVFMDVVEYSPTQNKEKLLPVNLKDRILSPREEFLWKDVFPLRLFAFNDFSSPSSATASTSKSDKSDRISDFAVLAYGPKNPFRYLTRVYGSKKKEPTWINERVVTSHSDAGLLATPCRIRV